MSQTDRQAGSSTGTLNIDRASGLVGNLAIKTPVIVATTANITLSGEQTIDGIACVEYDRVLVKDQTTGSENGIWVVSTGAWNRSADFDGVYDATNGTLILVTKGNTYANFVFKLNTDDPVIGTSSLSFLDQTPSSLASLAASSGSSLVGFIQSGTGGVATTVQEKLRESVSVKDFGAAGDGTTDDTAAIQAAIVACEASRNNELHFPAGTYKITGTLTCHGGIRLIGHGAMGAQDAQGVSFLHYANATDMVVWDGNHTSSAFGIGGGIFSIQCVKANGYAGGDALKLLATDDSHRPGEFNIEHVLVYGSGSATWSRGLHVDGSACTTPGGKGVRSIHMYDLRVADTTVAKQSIYFNQALHVYGDFAVDEGNGTDVGVTVAGDSTNHFYQMRVGGTYVVSIPTTAETQHFNITGMASTVDINSTWCVGTACLVVTTGLNNASKELRVMSNLADAFYATVNTTIPNVTGDGTIYTVIFETEQFDKNSSYDTATGIFTAEAAGFYSFEWQFSLSGITAAETRMDNGLLHKSSGGAVLNSIISVANPYAMSISGNISDKGSAILFLAEADTVRVIATVSNGTKVVDITGSAGTRYSFFSGKLLS